MIGKTLGHYQIQEKLGEGGMGVVYKARDTHLDRFVAIKVLPRDKVADAERKRRFVQEAKAASALNNPNIVTIHDINQADGIDYMAMEYVAGRSLDHLIGRRGMRLSEALKNAVQIADALARAHSARIIHRDLKPSNVMVNEQGLVKVLDFGLAKLTESPESIEGSQVPTVVGREPRTESGIVVGTVAYMSPEQAEGRPVDSRSDIFSFGVMLYEMVTGQLPFRGDSKLSILGATLHQDPVPPRQLVAELPAEVERIILRCLRKDPARRFQHMEDLKVALEELHEDTVSGSITGGRVLVQSKPARRSLLRIAAVISLLAALLFAGGLWWQFFRKPAGEAPLSAVPLTSYPGHVYNPSLSPDGNQVAFTWDGEKQDNLDIYLKLIGPGAPLRLTTDPAQDLAPCWAPDGRSIAFVRITANQPAAIMLIPALGGPERKLAEGDDYASLSWSPDGQWLLVSRRIPPVQPHLLYALSVSTGEWHELARPQSGAWAGDLQAALSPDGHTLAFSRSMTRANSEIYLLQVSESLEPKGEPRQLTFENRTSTYPTWTPDGREIIFSSGGTGLSNTGALWRIRADAPARTRATRIPLTEGAIAPSLSRQGRLVFSRANNDENIWRLPLAGGKSGSTERFIFSTRRDVEPRYSRDGRRIAFTSDRSGAHEVWVCEADGSNPLQLTSMNATMTGGARWSPDGKRLVFLSTLPGQQEIYLIGANGGQPIRLTNHPGHDSAPSWSRDGKWIYFASNRSGRFEVWKMFPDSNATPVQVTRNGGFAAIESVDGKTLYFARSKAADRYEICRMPADGGPEAVVVPLMGTWGDFDVTDRGVYYIASRDAGAEIRLLSFSGSDTKLGVIEKRPSFGLCVAPDNSSVLYTQFDVESSELMLIENIR